MSHPPPYTFRMKNIIRDQKQTAEPKIRPSPIGWHIVSDNPKSKWQDQLGLQKRNFPDFRHLMSPNFALILSTSGCDDPSMILPSAILPSLLHLFAPVFLLCIPALCVLSRQPKIQTAGPALSQKSS